MLERVTDNRDQDLLVFRNIQEHERGSGICFVRDGKHGFSRTSKPFITLYLQDTQGMVIPGYIFDVENFIDSGMDLTSAVGSIVRITYEENFIPNYGLSLRLLRVMKLDKPTTDIMSAFTGSVDKLADKYDYLQKEISMCLGVKYIIPFSVQTASHMDYSQGRAGGLLNHYVRMYRVLRTYVDIFGEANIKQLFGTFVLFIHAHSNFVLAEKEGRADIGFANKLTATVFKVMDTLHLGDGAMEVCNVFFGYQPKDIFVRTICQVSENILRVSKEKAIWDTLPVTREGNAGYGAIRRYKEKQG